MEQLEFSSRFATEEDCECYLRARREKQGMNCPKCGSTKMYWDNSRKRWVCRQCRKEVTLTSGTLMHGSKLPLLYWFTAIHLLTSSKKTLSALEMQRQLGHKRYQPIWEMMHKLRSVMGVRDSRHMLSDSIELDEGCFTLCKPKWKPKIERSKRGAGSAQGQGLGDGGNQGGENTQ